MLKGSPLFLERACVDFLMSKNCHAEKMLPKYVISFVTIYRFLESLIKIVNVWNFKW